MELVWKHRGKKYGKDIARIMGEVGTLYLEGFTVMSAHADTGLTWTK